MRNVTGAIRTIKENNALGGACGVLCPTPRLCEKECSATGIGRAIEIGKIQRFLIEHGWSLGFKAYEQPAPRPEKVAVVGSGPAGLSCAAELARQGVQVTVFEERAEPGGVIRYGVPAYRFDKAFLKNELQDLKDLGVKFKCNSRVEGAGAAQKLLDSGFRAVFLAPGLWGAEKLPVRGKTKGVYTSVDFLALLREERFEELARQVRGKAVAVIGGGSVAMDCAESAFKLGARDVYLVYRRSYAQMPAEVDERLAAQGLGVHFLLLNQPTGYQLDGSGRVKGLRLLRTRLGTEARRPPQAGGDQGSPGPWRSPGSRPSATVPIRPTGRASRRWTVAGWCWPGPRTARPRPAGSSPAATWCAARRWWSRRCRTASWPPGRSWNP
jgi:NADPH-dependent glutamate synthase beta subunit-like oxidoreductase